MSHYDSSQRIKNHLQKHLVLSNWSGTSVVLQDVVYLIPRQGRQ